MANVGTAAPGKVLIGTGNGASPTFADIGTNSGLTNHGIILGKGNSAFGALPVGLTGEILIGNTGADPNWGNITSTGGNFLLNSGNLNYIPSNYTQGYSNIGIAYSAGTFTVQSASGTAFSSTNPGYVVFNNGTTPGQLVTISITSNQTFTDGAAGTTATQRFGLLSGDVWGANDIPFFLYAVQKSDQTAVAFMISRNPAAKLSPAAASIGQSGAIVNVGQNDFFSLSAITASQYASQPCVYLGCFRMRFVGATNSWTVQALDANKDGLGLNFDATIFNMPAGVQGAASGSFFFTNGGTAPIWSSQQLTYKIQRTGILNINFAVNTNTTPGSGAVDAILALPYSFNTNSLPYRGIGWFVPASNVVQALFPISAAIGSAPRCLFFTNGNAGVISLVVLGAAGSTISANFDLGIYTN